MWTVAEGAVYPDFDENIHYLDSSQVPWGQIVKYYAGVDWGFDHYGSIVIVGETADGICYLVDGIADKGQYIDWWIEQANQFKSKYANLVFYADSARPEHISQFNVSGLKTLNANKSVIPGIENVARHWKNQQLFVVKGVLPRFEEEITLYRWKENSMTDEVIKENDDVMDALRYALSHKIYNTQSTEKRYENARYFF